MPPPSALAVLPPTMFLDDQTFGSSDPLKWMPPPLAARFVNTFVHWASLRATSMPPPLAPAELPVMVVLAKLTCPVPDCPNAATPPPLPVALLLLIDAHWSVALVDASRSMPPPLPPAVLPVTTSLGALRVPPDMYRPPP